MRAAERPPEVENFNPLTKLAAALIWFVAATLVFDPVYLAALLAMLVAVCLVFARVSPGRMAMALLFFALAGLGFLQANLLFHQTAGWHARSLSGVGGIGAEAWRDGITLFLRAIVYGAISLAFVASTDPASLVRALMRHARLPPFIAFSVLSALQFLPALADDLRQMRLARAMRGGAREGRFTAWTGLATQLIAGALRRAGRAAIAMEARGLARGAARTSLRPSPFSWRDAALLAAALALPVLLWRLLT